MKNDEQIIRQSFVDQARWCKSLGSPFMERLMLGVVSRLDRTTRTGRRILEWQGGKPDATGDAVALRLAGALHYHVRTGALPSLEPYYAQGAVFDDAELIDAVMDAIGAHDDEICAFLDFAPQTNEVRRASAIYAGLLELQKLFPMPVALFELGCSAGLNLQLAEFSYNFLGTSYGNKTSSVCLEPKWEGPLPEDTNLQIVMRQGCDLNPLSVTEQDNCDRLMSYVWPDQFDRLERTQAAIDIAKADPPTLFKADAASWVEDALVNNACVGSARVFYHTIAWQYFPAATKASIRESFERYGKQATKDNPLGWLSLEMNDNDVVELAMQVWPEGKRTVLAHANAHVQWINWLES